MQWNRFLYRSLVNGAKPFFYRSRVRSLLGLPEDRDGNLAFPLNLPLVGFRYINANHTHSFFGGFPGVAPGLNRDRMMTLQNNPIKEDTPQSSGGQDTKIEGAPVQETGKRENIEIPGFFERCIAFPSLFDEKNDKIPLQGKQEKPLIHEIRTKQGEIKDVSPDKIERASGRAQKPKRVIEKVTETEIPLQGRQEKPLIYEIGTKEGEIKHVGNRHACSPIQLLGTTPKHQIVSRSYQEAVLRIERLRQDVHRLNALNAKTPSHSSGASSAEVSREIKDDQLQIPKPSVSSVQSVVFPRSSFRQGRTRQIPCAFWERSFMGRFHLKTLR